MKREIKVYNYPIDDSEAVSLLRLYHYCESVDSLNDDVANLADFFNAIVLETDSHL